MVHEQDKGGDMNIIDNFPEKIQGFLHDLIGVLGDRLVGIFLYGSWAAQNNTDASDLDLAVVVSDADAEGSRQEIYRLLDVCGVDRNLLSMSVETYMRIKDFLKKGDPFAWVVCSKGIIIKERDNLLAELQKNCSEQEESFEVSAVIKYLQNKSSTHYIQAMQALNQFYSNIQLSLMSGAQAISANHHRGNLKSEELVSMADFEHLKGILKDAGATRREVESVERFINAHKMFRKTDTEFDEFPGKDLLAGIRAAGELWNRLLPKGT